MLDESKRWHLLRVQPKYEKSVASALKYREIEVYVPITKVIKYWTDKQKQVFVPLFPGLVFCNLLNAEMQDVLNMDHVIDFDSRNSNIMSDIPKEEIEIIRLLEKGNPIISDKLQYDGEEVMVADGPFAGFHGVMIPSERSQRLLVKLNALQQFVSVDIAPFGLRKANSSHSLAS
jgi:transcription antitermination factor NusG